MSTIPAVENTHVTWQHTVSFLIHGFSQLQIMQYCSTSLAKKNLHVSEPMQSKPVLFKGQLYLSQSYSNQDDMMVQRQGDSMQINIQSQGTEKSPEIDPDRCSRLTFL